MNPNSGSLLHICASTPFSVKSVSVGIFPGFDHILVFRHHDRFGKVLEWCRSYLFKHFSAEVYFKEDVVDSDAFLLVYRVVPYNGLPHFDISVRVFASNF